MWPAPMQIYRNKRRCLQKKRVQFPQDWFKQQHGFGTPIWLRSIGGLQATDLNMQTRQGLVGGDDVINLSDRLSVVKRIDIDHCRKYHYYFLKKRFKNIE